jgi:hypothetical protein
MSPIVALLLTVFLTVGVVWVVVVAVLTPFCGFATAVVRGVVAVFVLLFVALVVGGGFWAAGLIWAGVN